MLASSPRRNGPAPERKPSCRRSVRRRTLFALIYTGWLILLAIGGIKLFWWIQYGQLSQTEPSQEVVWRHYYAEVFDESIASAPLSLTDDRLDLLLLGGSVMEQTENWFEDYITAHPELNASVYMVARAAHNSRDSALKYRCIADRPFDYVLVYNGINDVPMNYIPEDRFDLEYRHCSWFYSLDRRLAAGRIHLKDAFRDTLQRYAVRARPDEDMLPFGATVKTPPALAANLEEIVDRARAAGSIPVLMTFAYYIEPGYNRAAYLAGEYSYGEGPFGMPVEDWGLPEHVPAIMDAQNRAIRELARRKDVLLVDQAKLITGRDSFCDVCHLSYAGCEVFVQNVMSAIRQSRTPPGPDTGSVSDTSSSDNGQRAGQDDGTPESPAAAINP